jgi:endonuclease G
MPVVRQNPDGSVTWTIPVEVKVAAPTILSVASQTAANVPASPVAKSPLAEAAGWMTENFDDRAGYDPDFLEGFSVPLPGTKKLPWRLAKNQLAKAGADPHVLPYHHYSIVMNADRRLCAFTAVNIDGATIKAVVRETKQVIDHPSLKDLGVESIGGAEAAESSDDFRPDRRILPAEQMNREFYEGQIVAGFPDSKSKARIARIFQKGHITLRGDPAWGSEDEAVAAERDTFFYTNAAPQLGFFNQGSRLDHPGEKGTLRWRAVETYVLRNAVTMGSRISVFAGPVFDDVHDPVYRFGAKVPMRFWKLAMWSDGTQLRSIALLADQSKLIEVMPEAFVDENELARVTEFLTTVVELEHLTKLDFGKAVRDGDVRAGLGPLPALDGSPEALNGGLAAKRQGAHGKRMPRNAAGRTGPRTRHTTL